jgi:cell division transport system permease protein
VVRHKESARRHKSTVSDQFSSLLRLHKHEARLSAERIRASGSTSLLTALVIAIALALPTSLHLLLNNVQALLNSWDQQSNLTLFLESGLNDEAAMTLDKKIRAWPEIKNSRYISAEQALEDFRESSGLEEVLATLDVNPLPAAFVIEPKVQQVHELKKLEKRLTALSGVDAVVIDTAWIARLNAMLELGERFILALGAALSGAVLLVIFNTIRLAIANRADEISITKLVGATDAFVRRPFLYTGAWFGLAGGIIALVLAETLIILLQKPVIQLASLYQSDYILQGVSLVELFYVPVAGLSIGIVGAYMAVSNYLRDLAPE